MRWKLDRIREKMSGIFGGRSEPPRPKLCPACGTLVGATATRCHQCGASLTFSVAAASRSLGRLLPAASPATYGVLSLSCLLYLVSLLWTIRLSGFQMPEGGGISGIFNLGGINGEVLQRMGASLPLAYNLAQPWRFVTAIFLHGSILHIAFNMWVLISIGPQVEELYGSARCLFIYVAAGIGGYVLSSLMGNFSVGGSGGLLGLIGVLLAMTMGRRSAGMQMLRGQLIVSIVYIGILGIFSRVIDSYAHLGGLATGFVLGKIMTDRPPATPGERKRAYLLGWGAGLAVVASFAMVAIEILRGG